MKHENQSFDQLLKFELANKCVGMFVRKGGVDVPGNVCQEGVLMCMFLLRFDFLYHSDVTVVCLQCEF